MTDPRLVFMGTPDYAARSLEALCEAGYRVVGVFCQPDRPSGRGHRLAASPAKQAALARGIPVFQPQNMRGEGLDRLRALAPDLCVTAAFGQILPQSALSVPPYGTINVHASLLPKYRGSSPIAWCLLNGETVTGVTTMLTDKGIDTGDILLQRPVPIAADDDAGTLTEKLAAIGAALLLDTVPAWLSGGLTPRRQAADEASYYPMLDKAMGELDWSEPAERLVNRVRGLTPWPGARFESDLGPIKVLKAAFEPADAGAPGDLLSNDPQRGLVIKAASGALRVLTLKGAGGKAMPAEDFLRGHRLNQIIR